MNRRSFFSRIAAAITAAVMPIDFSDDVERSLHDWDYDPVDNIWWQRFQSGKLIYHSPNYAQVEARTIAALERAWKECARTGQSPDQIWITDEQLMEYGDEIHRKRRS